MTRALSCRWTSPMSDERRVNEWPARSLTQDEFVEFAESDRAAPRPVRFICIDGELLDLRSAIVADRGEA